MAAEGEKKIYVFEEVEKHHATKDCWLIINGKVYDVTPFMDEHPGGDEVLLAATRRDATADFEDVGHSKTARELMAKYYIGEVDSSTLPSKPAYVPAPQVAPPRPAANSNMVITILQVLTPIVMLAVAFALRNFKSEK